MEIGFAGFGKMGKPMALKLIGSGTGIVAWNRSPDRLIEAQKAGARIAATPEEIGRMLLPPRIVWLMITSGEAVDEVLFGSNGLVFGLEPGDIVIDGGNSFFKDSLKRQAKLKLSGISLLDCGTSGGLEGVGNGLCLTIGGEEDLFYLAEPVFKSLSAGDGSYLYTGATGSGHFVKMVHNAIEYGMMQSLGEGFELLAKGPFRFDLPAIAENWEKGSVIRSWLMELCSRTLGNREEFDKTGGYIAASGEAAWAVETAREFGIPLASVELALKERLASEGSNRFAHRLIAALRREFGGHQVSPRRRG